jgi:hypothetical protein
MDWDRAGEMDVSKPVVPIRGEVDRGRDIVREASGRTGIPPIKLDLGLLEKRSNIMERGFMSRRLC